MRINNNLMAMNTHRQLGINNGASAKSIEKLSSGSRINRAGDDAAGLAISEKMRGQIRGLDQASRNSQDAISLVQTAEGALNETQDILQRMRELAVQSANDTNETDDRDAIQSEMDQLTSEINRISETTEFNNKTLLDGSLSAAGAGIGITNDVFNAGTNGVDAITISDDASIAEAANYGVTITSETSAKAVGTALSSVDTATVAEGSDVDLAGGAYRVEIVQADVKQMTAAGADDSAGSILVNGDSSLTLEADSSLTDGAHTLNVAKAQIASSVGNGLAVDLVATAADSGTYTVETSRVVDDAKVTGTLKTNAVVTGIEVADDATLAQIDTLNELATDATITMAVLDNGAARNATATFTFADGDGGTSVVSFSSDDVSSGATTIEIAGLKLTVDVDEVFAGVDLGTDAVDAATYTTNVLTLDTGVALDQLSVTDSNSGLVATGTAVAGTGNDADVAIDFDGGGAEITFDHSGVDFVSGNTLSAVVQSEYTISLELDAGSVQVGSDLVVTELEIGNDPGVLNNISFGGSGANFDLSSAALSAAGASTDVTFVVEVADGYSAQLQKADGSTAGLNGGKFTLTDDGATVVNHDIGDGVTLDYAFDNVAGEGTLDATTPGYVYFGVDDSVEEFTLTVDGEEQVIGAGDTAVFDNGVSIETNAALTAGGPAMDFDVEGSTEDLSVKMQIGANTGQKIAIGIDDMGSSALKVSSTDKTATETVTIDSEVYTAKYNQTESVDADGSTSEFSLDISNHDNATAAVNVINEALSSVSDQRAKLGAVQNRLEHTIKNLDTSAENLQASESRIRDVDMAKEMMEFTKNNILSQAAQSMLAQANQAPQGVLQLLR